MALQDYIRLSRATARFPRLSSSKEAEKLPVLALLQGYDGVHRLTVRDSSAALRKSWAWKIGENSAWQDCFALTDSCIRTCSTGSRQKCHCHVKIRYLLFEDNNMFARYSRHASNKTSIQCCQVCSMPRLLLWTMSLVSQGKKGKSGCKGQPSRLCLLWRWSLQVRTSHQHKPTQQAKMLLKYSRPSA